MTSQDSKKAMIFADGFNLYLYAFIGYRNATEVYRRSGSRRIAPFISTQALRLWVEYSRRGKISFTV